MINENVITLLSEFESAMEGKPSLKRLSTIIKMLTHILIEFEKIPNKEWTDNDSDTLIKTVNIFIMANDKGNLLANPWLITRSREYQLKEFIDDVNRTQGRNIILEKAQ